LWLIKAVTRHEQTGLDAWYKNRLWGIHRVCLCNLSSGMRCSYVLLVFCACVYIKYVRVPDDEAQAHTHTLSLYIYMHTHTGKTDKHRVPDDEAQAWLDALLHRKRLGSQDRNLTEDLPGEIWTQARLKVAVALRLARVM